MDELDLLRPLGDDIAGPDPAVRHAARQALLAHAHVVPIPPRSSRMSVRPGVPNRDRRYPTMFTPIRVFMAVAVIALVGAYVGLSMQVPREPTTGAGAASGASGPSPTVAQPSPGGNQLTDAVTAARDYARSLDDTFGGAWVTDDGAVFAFTYHATDAQIADVLSRLGSWVPVSIVRVDYSEAALTGVAQRVHKDIDAGSVPYVTSVDIDLPGNALSIGIASPGSCARQAELRERYGDVRLSLIATPASPAVSGSPASSADPGASSGAVAPTPSLEPCESPASSASPTVAVAPTEEWGPMAVVSARDISAGYGTDGKVRLVIGERCVTMQGVGDARDSRVTLAFSDGQVTWDPEHERIRFHNLPADSGSLWLENGDLFDGAFGGYDPWSDTGAGPAIPAWVVRPNADCPEQLFLVTEVDIPQ